MTATPNPYEPPQAALAVAPIDNSRDALATLMRSFLASEITAFKFDQQLEAFYDSADPVINHVVEALWYHYDDCCDHLVCLNKPEWDYFQRLLLVLAADSQVEAVAQREWSFRQLVAAAALASFAILVLKLGSEVHWMLLAIPFGLVSMALSFWRPTAQPTHDPFAPIIFPFATFSDLAEAHRQSGFRKTRYPKEIADRRIRSPWRDAIVQLQAYVMWLIFAPIPLAMQTLPFTSTEIRIRTIK